MNHNKPLAVIVDVDGTLARRNGREVFDWTLIESDIPNRPLILLLGILRTQGIEVLIVSGREERLISQTQAWLTKNGIETEYLFFRSDKDFRMDSVIKREIFERHIRERFSVVAVFDDRNQTVKMWREELNLLCLQVEDGNF